MSSCVHGPWWPPLPYGQICRWPLSFFFSDTLYPESPPDLLIINLRLWVPLSASCHGNISTFKCKWRETLKSHKDLADPFGSWQESVLKGLTGLFSHHTPRKCPKRLMVCVKWVSFFSLLSFSSGIQAAGLSISCSQWERRQGLLTPFKRESNSPFLTTNIPSFSKTEKGEFWTESSHSSLYKSFLPQFLLHWNIGTDKFKGWSQQFNNRWSILQFQFKICCRHYDLPT